MARALRTLLVAAGTLVTLSAIALLEERGQFLLIPGEEISHRSAEPLPVTRVYSGEVGKVVAESREPHPRYKLTGEELYVRARVLSDRRHPNPFKKGDVEMA